MGEIFKVSPEFKTTSTNALKIAAYFKNANNKYFIGQLRTIQKEIYGKYIQPMIPGDTRWNSYLTCCSSIKATKNALRVCKLNLFSINFFVFFNLILIIYFLLTSFNYLILIKYFFY